MWSHLRARLFSVVLVAMMLGSGLKGGKSEDATTFHDLAKERFEGRVGRITTPDELTWTFEQIQFVRVPKAGSTSTSVLARRLVGCYPSGPCCVSNGGNEVDCPSKQSKCRAVAGCIDHNTPDEALLQDPSIFSMANIRDTADRIVSSFFYHGSEVSCAKGEEIDYFRCFLSTIITPKFQNVASKMLTGRSALDSSIICIDQADSKKCIDDLPSVIRGACNLNFITMCESWSTSVLLLFETLTWLAPSEDFFPNPPTEPASGQTSDVSVAFRRNTDKKYDEGKKHITKAMREMAREANAVDEELHEFVSAKFCYRLDEVGLLKHPLVLKELESFEPLYERCTNSSWTTATLERFAPLTPEDCRLYESFARPQGLE